MKAAMAAMRPGKLSNVDADAPTPTTPLSVLLVFPAPDENVALAASTPLFDAMFELFAQFSFDSATKGDATDPTGPLFEKPSASNRLPPAWVPATDPTLDRVPERVIFGVGIETKTNMWFADPPLGFASYPTAKILP